MVPAMSPFEALGEQTRHNGRRGGRENHLGRSEPVKLGENRVLCLDALRKVLLDEDRAVERIGEVIGGTHARGCGLRIVEEALRGEITKPLSDEGTSFVDNVALGIVEGDLETAACKHDRPGATDQTGSDHGDAIVHIHSIFLLSARSSRRACEGPVQVTEPRSNTTVRSESASARSR